MVKRTIMNNDIPRILKRLIFSKDENDINGE